MDGKSKCGRKFKDRTQQKNRRRALDVVETAGRRRRKPWAANRPNSHKKKENLQMI
jgi:hypothetical protein